MESICSKCKITLTNENWWPSNQKIRKTTCNNCVNKSMRPTYKRFHEKQRLRALRVIVGDGPIRCAYCNCDDLRLLEINHKYGGGRKETGTGNDRHPTEFYRAIINGTRSIYDLEIACRVCNAHHYLELKYGPLPFTVTWIPISSV